MKIIYIDLFFEPFSLIAVFLAFLVSYSLASEVTNIDSFLKMALVLCMLDSILYNVTI